MSTFFEHSPEVWSAFPELAAAVLLTPALPPGADVEPWIARGSETARARLAGRSEAELPEIRAWRRAYARMGLKPTAYRCAAEALLRRLRKEGSLPRVQPLVDLCNAASLAAAVPVAVFDLDRVTGSLQVRRATGTEQYLPVTGPAEHPVPGEVVYADSAGRAHARRWCNRQSGASAVTAATRRVLVVAEAVHDTAAADVARLAAKLGGALAELTGALPTTALLRRACPRVRLDGQPPATEPAGRPEPAGGPGPAG